MNSYLPVFIIYVLVYIVAIIKTMLYKGKVNLGIYLSLKWIYFIAIFELIILLLLLLIYVYEYEGDIMFFSWSISILYFRGIILSFPFLVMFSSLLPAWAEIILIYVSALLFDYVTFLFISCVKERLLNQSNNI